MIRQSTHGKHLETLVLKYEDDRMPAWLHAHIDAVLSVNSGGGTKQEQAIYFVVEGWLMYADSYRARHNRSIGDDEQEGAMWSKMGVCITQMLDGNLDRLNRGILIDVMQRAAIENGMAPH